MIQAQTGAYYTSQAFFKTTNFLYFLRNGLRHNIVVTILSFTKFT